MLRRQSSSRPSPVSLLGWVSYVRDSQLYDMYEEIRRPCVGGSGNPAHHPFHCPAVRKTVIPGFGSGRVTPCFKAFSGIFLTDLCTFLKPTVSPVSPNPGAIAGVI